MRARWLWLVVLAFLVAGPQARGATLNFPPGTAFVTTAAPSGACSNGQLDVATTASLLWFCSSNTWTQAGVTSSPTFTGTSTFTGTTIFKGPVPWYDVKAYGALGDGVTNDTAAIQSAFTAAATNGTVYFPNGTYHLAGAGCAYTVGTNGKDFAIIGQSRVATIIDASSCANTTTVLTTTYLLNVFTLKNLTIKASTSQTGMRGLVAQADTVLMDNVIITPFSDYAANMFSVTICDISNSGFNSGGAGGATRGLLITSAGNRCNMRNIYTSGLFIGSAGNATRNVHITGSLLDDHFPTSVSILGNTTTDIHIEDSLIYTNSGGIGLQVGDGATTPARVSVLNTLIGPFSTGYAELWNVLIQAGATDTVLTNVATQVQNAGGDISDAGTNTRFINVTRNGTFGGSGGTYNWIQQGTAVMGVTEKAGSGAGNYTTTSATFVNVDGTNLTTGAITIPTGWNDRCVVSASVDTSTLGATVGLAIADGGTVKREQTMTQAVASDLEAMTVQWVAVGDGASHTITPQWKVSAGTATMANSTATLLPNMVCTLMPSN